jgi:heat-inducible transcriptional repressor
LAKPVQSRKFEILHSIVKSYIESGEPVASRSISKERLDHLSPASIRNIMADLSDEGYLEQPHTSAGRIPTALAFESYVQSLAARRPSFSDMHRMRTDLSQAATIESFVERSSQLLMQMTRSVGIAAAIPVTDQTLDHIELVVLDSHRILMVVVTRNRMMRNRVIYLRQPISRDDVNSICNYLNAEFAGWTVRSMRMELQRRLAHERALYDEILRKLAGLYSDGALDLGFDAELHLQGASNLIGIDLDLTRERLRDLFLALEEKERMLELLERFLEVPAGELGVQFGLGEIHPSMAGLALIGVKVMLPDGMSAKMAVLGPMRMNYERVISAVHQVSEAAGAAAGEVRKA